MIITLYDDSPLRRPGKKKNWVVNKGGLPGPVRARARALMREHPDWTRERAIATAINAVKYSAATGDSKLPGKQNQRKGKVAAHRAAAGKWEKMKLTDNGDGTMTITLADVSKDNLRKEKNKQVPANKNSKNTKKKNDNGTGPNKEGAESSSGGKDVDAAEAAFNRKKGKMSPEERKKVAARIASRKQQAGKKGTVPK